MMFFVFFWRRKKFLEEKKNFGGEKNLIKNLLKSI